MSSVCDCGARSWFRERVGENPAIEAEATPDAVAHVPALQHKKPKDDVHGGDSVSFLAFSSAAPEAAPILPLVHTTDWYDYQDIRKEGRLKPTACPVYEEDLLYFYYGRPGLRKHPMTEPVSLDALHLVSLVFEAKTLPSPKRVLPFDSGAFAAGLYKGDLHPKMVLADFELEPSLSGVTRAVSRFYGTNLAYYRSAVRSDMVADCEQFEVQSYLSIVRTMKASSADDRRSAVEVQVDKVVRIKGAKVLAVILPEQFLDHRPTEQYIEEVLGAEPLGYYCPHARPAEDARAIMNEAWRFYKERGLL